MDGIEYSSIRNIKNMSNKIVRTVTPGDFCCLAKGSAYMKNVRQGIADGENKNRLPKGSLQMKSFILVCFC